MEHPRDRDDRARRVLGPLEHDRAAGAHRRRDLADRLVVREVPRRERRAHADRLAQHQLAHVGQPRRDHSAVDPAALLGVPVAVVGAAGDFAHRLGERLALVERDVACDRLGALAGQVGDAAQDAAALERRGVPPGLERALRGRERAVEVGRVRVRQAADRLAGRRVEHVLLAAPVALDELAVDVEAQVFVGGAHRLSGSVWTGGGCGQTTPASRSAAIAAAS